jgi:hypothetical protein
MKSDLLKEAIADAKAVKETALANAKMALEEAFTPKLQSMLSHKIAEELEEEDEEEVADEMDAAATMDEPAEDEMAAEEDEMGVEEEEEMYSEEGEEDMTMDMDSEEDGEEYDVTGDEEEETEEDDLDLEAVIRELEDAMAGEEEVSEEDEMGEEPVAEEEMEDEPVAEEEELDINEIIRALKEMDGEEETVEEEETEESWNEEKEEELAEAYNVITSLKKTINEVNLLNAKLLYTNKLFRTFDLNENQKMKVIENFDRAASLREVKLVYATLGENLNVARKNKTVVKESLASKPMKSSAPKKEILSEGAAVAERFKKLAGLNK